MHSCRFFVIVHPFRPRMNIGVCIAIITAIWITSMSISVPLAIYQTVTVWPSDDGTSSVRICHENWPSHTSRQFFAITSLVLQYVVPCTVITFCYLKVGRKVRV